jgi:hypothetical protein
MTSISTSDVLKPKVKLGLARKQTQLEMGNIENHSISPPSSANMQSSANMPDFSSLTKLNSHISEIIENNVFLIFCEIFKKVSIDYKLDFGELKTRYLSYFQKDLNHSNLFCDLLSANLETMDINHLKQEIANGKLLCSKYTNNPKTSACSERIDPVQPITPQTDQVLPSAISVPPAISAPQGLSNSHSCDSLVDETENVDMDTTKCYARTANSKQCSRKKQKGQDFCGSHLHNQPHGRIDQTSENNQNKPKRRGRPPKSSPKIGPDEPTEVVDTASISTEITQLDAQIETINI